LYATQPERNKNKSRRLSMTAGQKLESTVQQGIEKLAARMQTALKKKRKK